MRRRKRRSPTPLPAEPESAASEPAVVDEPPPASAETEEGRETTETRETRRSRRRARKARRAHNDDVEPVVGATKRARKARRAAGEVQGGADVPGGAKRKARRVERKAKRKARRLERKAGSRRSRRREKRRVRREAKEAKRDVEAPVPVAAWAYVPDEPAGSEQPEAAKRRKKRRSRKREKKAGRAPSRRSARRARKAGQEAEREAGPGPEPGEERSRRARRKARKKARKAEVDELRPPRPRSRRKAKRQARKQKRKARRAERHRGERRRLSVVLLVGGALVLSGRAVADGAVDVGAGEPADGATPAADPFHGGTSRTWYCAAGTTGAPADHHVIITNPSEQPAEGTLTLYGDGAGADRESGSDHSVRVPSEGEVEIRAADLDDPVLEETGQGAAPHQAVAAPVGVVTEFDHPVSVRHRVEGPNGEDEGPCADRPASTWHVPWGTTTRDATHRLVLFNPFPNDVVVDARFSTDEGVREPVRWQGLAVPAQRAVIMDVGEDVTRRDHVAVTVEARSGSLVVESIQEFDGSLGPVGLTLEPGDPVGGTATVLDAGRVGEEDSELLAVQNPGDEPVDVTVRARPEGAGDGERVPAPFELVVREGRAEVLDLSGASRVDTSRGYSIDVSADAPVVVERVVLEQPESD